MRVELQPAAGGTAVSAILVGVLNAASCTDDAGHLSATYAQTITCQPGAPNSCSATFDGLQPGEWSNKILVTEGEARGQLQGRAQLLLDRAAGTQVQTWPLYRSLQTVVSLDDAPDCTGCLRAAIAAAEIGTKPALIQFAPDLAGTVRLRGALPPLLADEVTIDGLDGDGIPLTRTIDANGLSIATLRIAGAHCQVLGLRLVNAGGDSDVVVVEGLQAVDTLLDSLQVVGRSAAVCGTNGSGCVVDGVCREPSAQMPRGFCGDDGIAVRGPAGAGAPNRIQRCLVSAAHDKGVKVSDGGVAVVEDSLIFGNVDGGLQATLGGQLTARRNTVIANRGTNSANGLAVNGAAVGSPVPGGLETRGNLSIGNALRGISVRSLSQAALRDDFVCGNGSAGSGNGFGVAVLDAAGSSAVASASGLAVVHNAGGGIAVSDNSRGFFGNAATPGANAVAFNGPLQPSTPANFRNLTTLSIAAVGNLWEHCGPGTSCNPLAVQALDIFTAHPHALVLIDPAQPSRRRAAPIITAIEPPFAAVGDEVRIYGAGFDAIEGTDTTCETIALANTCRPLRGNCVLINRTPADVIAVTPTMLVVRAPFTCVAPVPLDVRTHWAHGFGRAQFCTLPQ